MITYKDIFRYGRRVAAFVALTAICSPVLEAADGDLFKYPEVPADKVTLSERCNYLVYHFWDKANLTAVFSSRQKLHNTIGDWFGFMPYATADTVHMSIDRLIGKVSKNGPNTLTLAEMAEAWVYSDTSEMRSEELYLPFAKAASTHKKISKAERERFLAQVKVIETSGLGATLPVTLKFKNRDGQEMSIGDIMGNSILLAFVDPLCSDCQLDMVRLSADPNVKDLIQCGEMTVVMLYADKPNERWDSKVASMPAEWIAGTMPDADEHFDLTLIPTYYFLDGDYKVIAKDLVADQILSAAAVANARRKK